MANRYDISAVPPLGGYPAKQCPVRVQWDTIRPAEPLPPAPPVQRRLDRGIEFERQIVAELLACHRDARVIAGADRADRAERETATLSAMRAGVPVIIGGRLPADLTGHRVGEPDLLVVAGPGEPRYRAVDIKHHRSLRPVHSVRSAEPVRPGERASGRKPAAHCGPLGRPWLSAAEPAEAMTARKRPADLLQLAHYQRMLEAAGLAADDGRHGGIIGVEGMVTWFDLDALSWQTPSSSGRRKARSTMAVYDFEFGFRLDIVAVAAMHLADPEVIPLVVPVRISECDECPWWSWCGERLRAGSGDVSLLPGVGWRAWRTHRDHAVTSRAALAALDHRTATLVAARVDLRPVLAAIGTHPDATPVADVIGTRKPGQLASLTAAGIATLGDARALCPVTAAYCDAPMADLADQIDQARAAIGDSPAYRRRGITRVRVPRGDVEVDIDMENTENGVYLWGVLVTSRSAGDWGNGYRAFSTWRPMTGAVEAELFGEFWGWLTRLREAVHRDGLSFRAYCYHAAAENGQLRRIATSLNLDSEVSEFINSGEWTDLLKVFDSQLITGESAGLKHVAALCGYRWSVPDPGGDTALVRYDEAVIATDPEPARQWLLQYNQCDVEATRALRDWLATTATTLPSVQDATHVP